ncbi:WD repeat-containing protein 43-like [Iris pallida]|uniref:WD repeat-containing protein 43-like n=1 Tax=Iris pallida TaxID=29817 RepID=A0AAX6F2U0_IRIPA|nr:WD repeat-containing protein 43-like [Iris pallida]
MGGEADANEPTMVEKLASLAAAEEEKEKVEQQPSSSVPVMPPSADSVHVRLKQALHTDDHSVLLQCLYTTDKMVISNTISHLTPADVLKLLNSLVCITRLRGAVLVCVLPWLESILSQHASSITSQESSMSVLNSLHQIIQSRISALESAIQLSTCLDVLSVQIQVNEVEDESTGPTIIYEDSDSGSGSGSDSGEEDDDDDSMDTEEEEEELGDFIDSPQDSDGSEVMSD